MLSNNDKFSFINNLFNMNDGYTLYKLYENNKKVGNDLYAYQYLMKSVELNNQYALFTVGKIKLMDGKDKEGIDMIIKSYNIDNNLNTLNYILNYLKSKNELLKEKDITLNEFNINEIMDKLEISNDTIETYVIYCELLLLIKDNEKFKINLGKINNSKLNNKKEYLTYLFVRGNIENNKQFNNDFYNRITNLKYPRLQSFIGNKNKNLNSINLGLNINNPESFYYLANYYENNNNIQNMINYYLKGYELYHLPSIMKIFYFYKKNINKLNGYEINTFIKCGKILINYDTDGTILYDFAKFLETKQEYKLKYTNKYLLMAVQKNNIKAIYLLGKIYLENKHFHKSDEGVKLLLKAYENDHYDALYDLVYYYDYKKDYSNLIKYGEMLVSIEGKIDYIFYEHTCEILSKYYNNKKDIENMIKYYKLIPNHIESLIGLSKYYYENKNNNDLNEIVDIFINKYDDNEYDRFFKDYKLSDVYKILMKFYDNDNLKNNIDNYIKRNDILLRIHNKETFEIKECIVCYEMNEHVKLFCDHYLCIDCYIKMNNRCYYRCKRQRNE